MNLGEHLKERPAPREMKHVSQMDPEELIHEFVEAVRNPGPVFYEDCIIDAGQRFEYLGEFLLGELNKLPPRT